MGSVWYNRPAMREKGIVFVRLAFSGYYEKEALDGR